MACGVNSKNSPQVMVLQNDYFGSSVSIDGDTAVISALVMTYQVQVRLMCMCAVMVCGVNSKNSPPVMVLQYDDFGRSVSIDGDTAVIGAPYEWLALTQVRPMCMCAVMACGVSSRS